MAGKADWKVTLETVEQSLVTIDRCWHGVVSQLSTILDDDEYRTHVNAPGTEEAAAWLDVRLNLPGRTGLTLLELLAVLRHFPAADDWATRPIHDLYAEARDRDRAARRPAPNTAEPAPPRRKATLKEVETLEHKNKELQFLAKKAGEEVRQRTEERDRLGAVLDSTKSTLDETRAEARAARDRCTRLEARIDQLEALLAERDARIAELEARLAVVESVPA